MLTPLLGSLHRLPLTTRREFRHLCLGEGAFHSLVPALRPHLSLCISQESLGYAALMNNPNISVAYPREVYFSLMLCAHCGPAGEFCSLWSLEDSSSKKVSS